MRRWLGLGLAGWLGLVPALLGQGVPNYYFATLAGAQPGLGAPASSSSGYFDSPSGYLARFNNPSGITVAPDGNIYVADGGNSVIRKITPQGAVTTYAGIAGRQGNADGPAGAATFGEPIGIAADIHGNLFVLDGYNYDVREISSSGQVVTVASLAGIGVPFGMAIDSADNVYVTEIDGSTVVKVTPGGQVSNFAGVSWSYLSYAQDLGPPGPPTTNGLDPSQEYLNGPAASALFNSPTYLAVDAGGDVFVADQNNGVIRKISNGIVSTVPNTPTAGPLVLDTAGNIYTANTTALQVYELSGGLSTLTGGETINVYINGVGTAATLSSPKGMAFSATGRLYIVDGNSIRVGIPTTQTEAQLAGPSLGAGVFGGHVGGDGQPATLSVSAGTSDIFQWFLNGSPIPGATTANYIPGQVGSTHTGVIGAMDAGTYTALITDPFGIVQQAVIGPFVIWSDTALMNLSARAEVGQDNLIVGFTTEGPDSKSVLVRGGGPFLSGYWVPNPLVSPELTLYSGTTALGPAIQGWDPSLAAIFAASGASTWAVGNADAATLKTFAPGSYTGVISSANGGTGVALAELYDASAASNLVDGTKLAVPGLQGDRLINLSARGQIGAGSNVLIAGFVIASYGGNNPGKTLLIRAVGPALAGAPYNIPGTVASTTMTVYDANGQAIATNEGWSNPATVGNSALITGSGPAQVGIEAATTAAFTQAGAWTANWSPGSGDSAIVITLPVGSYTVIVSGIDGAVGNGMVEIYDLD